MSTTVVTIPNSNGENESEKLRELESEVEALQNQQETLLSQVTQPSLPQSREEQNQIRLMAEKIDRLTEAMESLQEQIREATEITEIEIEPEPEKLEAATIESVSVASTEVPAATPITAPESETNKTGKFLRKFILG